MTASLTDWWHYESHVCKEMHNMQTSHIQANTLINWNNHETRPQGGCSVGARCVSQWTIKSAKEAPKHVWVWQLDQQGQAGRNQTIRHPAPCLHHPTIPVAGCYQSHSFCHRSARGATDRLYHCCVTIRSGGEGQYQLLHIRKRNCSTLPPPSHQRVDTGRKEWSINQISHIQEKGYCPFSFISRFTTFLAALLGWRRWYCKHFVLKDHKEEAFVRYERVLDEYMLKYA